jgi:hypothetical protein
MLNRKKNYKQLSKKIKTIFKNSVRESNDIKYDNVIFCPINSSNINTVKETFLGKFCELKGANVKFLLQESTPPFILRSNKTLESLNYRFKIKSNRKFIESIGLTPVIIRKKNIKPPIIFSELVKNKSSFHKFKYKDVQIGDLIIADTIRYFLCPYPLWNDKDFLKLLKKNFNFAIQLFESYSDFLEEEKPDKLIMSHGIYINWGLLFRIARQKNIPVDVYGVSYRKNTIRFYHNLPNAPWPESEWPKFKNIQLTENQKDIVYRYLRTREDQKDDNIVLFNDSQSNLKSKLDEFIKQAKIKNHKICTLFTNISWDAYAFSTKSVFETMEDWLRENIEFFLQNQNNSLIIKAHPSEVFFNVPKEYRVSNIVNEYKLTSNIFFIDEYQNLKPFDIYPYTDIGLLNISTVTIEMALKNKIVLTSGAGGQYSNKGFTIDPIDKNDYFTKLNNLLLNKLIFEPNIDLAEKYLFYKFFREAIPFDLLKSDGLFEKLYINYKNDKQFFNNPYIQKITEGILNDEDFILNPNLIEY